MTEPVTVAERAIYEASGEYKTIDRLLYTGRILVKQTFESAELPFDEEPEQAVQFLAPELRRWAKPLVRIAASGFKDKDPTGMMLKRILALNKAAKDMTEPISKYDKNGRVE